MRYFVLMNHKDKKPIVLYRFNSTNAVEETWVNNRWVDASNEIVESLFISGELNEVSRDYAEDFFSQAFSLV